MKLTNEWITGFVDGAGCFTIGKMNRSEKVNGEKTSHLRFRFIVSQDQRSTDVLYALKKHFGCGTVNGAGGGGNIMEYSITNRLHLRDKVIPHFVRYPLQSQKSIRFHEFVGRLQEYMVHLGEDAGRVVDPLIVSAKYQINAGWLRGMVDAAGCFSVSPVNGCAKPRFLLAMQGGQGELLRECQRFLNCGTLHTRKDGFETLEVANVPHMEQYVVPLFETRGSAVLLRTIKRISFQKWRKIVRLMMEKRHLDPVGLEKIRKYQAGLNKHNSSLTHRVQPGNSMCQQ